MTDITTIRPPVEPENVKERADRFRCVPYRLVITAESCCKRRAIVRAGIKKLEYASCVDGCPIGSVVERNSGGPIKLNTVIADGKGKSLKLAHAASSGRIFDGQGAPPGKRRRLNVIDGGRRDHEEPTIPALGDFMAAAQELPKAPPGRRPPSFPPPPAVVAAGTGGGDGESLSVPGADVTVTFSKGSVVDEEPAPAEFELTAPALPPAPTESKEREPMAKCKHEDGCDKEGRPAVPDHPETEGLCLRHRRALMDAAPRPKRKVTRGAKLKSKRTSAESTASDSTLLGTFEQFKVAVEDSMLVQRIGRERCRELAAMMDQVREEARATE